jgi:hypothetical protein
MSWTCVANQLLTRHSQELLAGIANDPPCVPDRIRNVELRPLTVRVFLALGYFAEYLPESQLPAMCSTCWDAVFSVVKLVSPTLSSISFAGTFRKYNTYKKKYPTITSKKREAFLNEEVQVQKQQSNACKIGWATAKGTSRPPLQFEGNDTGSNQVSCSTNRCGLYGFEKAGQLLFR